MCNTIDVVFNPEVFQMDHYNQKFQAMIIGIAIEASSKQLGERKETISKDYIVMKNLKCKGGEPALLPVRSIEGRLYNKGEGAGEERGVEGR